MPTNISTNSAAYRRWMQKANAAAYDDPGKFRIMMSLVDDQFAGEQMRKRILNVSRTMARERREHEAEIGQRRLTLAEKTLESETQLRGRRTELAEEAAGTARTLGYLNLPVSALSGYNQYRANREEAADIRTLRRRIYGADDDSGEFTPATPSYPQLSQAEITRAQPNLRRRRRDPNYFRPY